MNTPATSGPPRYPLLGTPAHWRREAAYQEAKVPYKDKERKRRYDAQRRKAGYWKSYGRTPKGRAESHRFLREAKEEIKNFLADYKGANPCTDCGQFYPYYVMDFDHRRGEKEFELSRAHQRTITLKKVTAEMEKCDLVCSNCHRIRTFTLDDHLRMSPLPVVTQTEFLWSTEGVR